eukprot:CAMPEP_0201281490 /NCGR_PEP_ID=MMETSP1317-20130820/2968_1 /ASSEMBLY_ACC=CAM_ASM_000770 /TAXON_ID=187299 /ORGANISM="Undescribed Undescribed, Strain Undescribed" /LENGTH=50 /DNA_ID=CAMNT_0047591415 /DNA_START=138 /DNA_END=290 /DNA_ORIENTATION=+
MGMADELVNDCENCILPGDMDYIEEVEDEWDEYCSGLKAVFMSVFMVLMV